jgi:murein DD-endopeptidase MepM/ murein hydrolase activator NlpD
MSRAVFIFLAAVLAISLGVVISYRPEAERREEANSIFGTYVSAVNWPPSANVLDEPFTCVEAGSERRMINDREYCITEKSEGAAGSIFTEHIYATEVNGRTLVMTFSTRKSQCDNYPQEERVECIAEQESFKPDQALDRFAVEQGGAGTKNLEETTSPQGPRISIFPSMVKQGDPARITINGAALNDIRSLTFNGKNAGVFSHAGKPTAFVGVDLRMNTDRYPLVLTLNDGTRIEEVLVVSPRQIAQAPLGIPESLGGNTPQAERQLINTLAQEGALISAVPSANRKLWEGPFRLPLDPPIVVTDTYGYSRITGGSNISHKGTDYRAAVGTPLYAMNSGTVRFTQNLRNYGNTIIIDHGLGLHTVYMHLSEIGVSLGQEVSKGQMIGRTGDTGYVIGPHLHLTIRINGISIDPERFMELFGS